MQLKTLLLLIFFVSYLQSSFSQNSPWLDGFDYGKYTVGYKNLLERDLSRPNIPFQNWAGQMEAMPPGKGRPVRICLWYPAHPVKGKPLNYSDYVRQLAQVVDFSAVTKERQEWAENWLISMINDLGGNGSFTKEKLNQLMPLRTKAYREASPISGKFPLVVFAEGASPATNSVMCEYLASHGYIVAALGMLGTYSGGSEVSTRGLLTMTADVQFAIQKASEKSNVAIGQIALIGLGFNASTCMSVQTLNPAIDAVISLEGGILSTFEDEMLNKLPQFEATAIDVPLLAIHAPHQYIDPSTIDYYVHSDRYFLNFKQMSEFHFLNYGLFELLVPNLLGESPGDTKKGHEMATKSCLAFLNGIFKEDKDILQTLQTLKKKEQLPDDFLTISKKASIPAPPDIAYLKDLFLKEGIDAIVALYREQQKHHSQPFSNKFYSAYNDWLAWQKDPDFSARKTLAQLRVESFPQSAIAHYYLGYYAEKNGDEALAKKGYTAALDLLDKDASLDAETKAAIEKNAKQALGLAP